MTLASNLSEQATTVLQERYLVTKDKKKETEEGLFRRVAKAVASPEIDAIKRKEWEGTFFDMMWKLDFVPNSPTLMNAGTGQGTLSACYVLPLNDSMDEITDTLKWQAMVEKFGGGVGFPLSNLRPKGHPINSTQGKACGPIQVLRTLSQVGDMITQGGKRDGAHMAIMSVYHPDIEEFISCKAKEGVIKNFNISIGADSTFMEAVKDDKFIHLDWPLDKTSYDLPQEDMSGRFIKAKQLFKSIVFGAWLNGEPGMVWLDRINKDNATPSLGEIQATNPCGEQPLLANERCNLGSINEANFVIHSPKGRAKFDSTRFVDTVTNAVRFLDNVVDINTHPTELTQEMNNKTRKIGLGIMGWGDLLFQLGIPYSDEEAIKLAHRVGGLLQKTADTASVKLGKDRGDFPAFADSPLNKTNGGAFSNMRNAWRLSIAPTGTIGMIANTSSSIEPVFALTFTKQNLSAALEDTKFVYVNTHFVNALNKLGMAEEDQNEIRDRLAEGESLQSMDYDIKGFDDLKKIFLTAEDVPTNIHVKTQSTFQQYVDSGISKTNNLPHHATEQDIYNTYMQAWEEDCKGITVYRSGSRNDEVLVTGNQTNKEEVTEEVSGQVDRWNRPQQIPGMTSKLQTGHGSLYVTINGDSQMPIAEVVAWTGKSGACEHASSEAFGRLISTALQHGVPVEDIVKQLEGIECCPNFHNGRKITSPADGIAYILSLEASHTSMNDKSSVKPSAVSKNKMTSGIPCPDCGSDLVLEAGCQLCRSCGFSMCG